MNFGGVGLIMSDVTIEFKNELFYGDKITIAVAIAEISKVSFALYYKLEKESGDNQLSLAAIARTGMVCYNYETKKIKNSQIIIDVVHSVFSIILKNTYKY